MHKLVDYLLVDRYTATSLQINEVNKMQIKDLIQAVAKNDPSKTHVSLIGPNNRDFLDLIHGTDIQDLVKALEKNTFVTHLQISNFLICEDGIQEIAKLLKINKTIKKLTLNEFSKLQLMLDALVENQSISELDLKYNPMNDTEGKMLIDFLKKNSRIVSLEISRSYTFEAIGLGGSETIYVSEEVLFAIKMLVESNKKRYLTAENPLKFKSFNFGQPQATTVESIKKEIQDQIFSLGVEYKLLTNDNSKLTNLLALQHLLTLSEYQSLRDAVAETRMRFPNVFTEPENNPTCVLLRKIEFFTMDKNYTNTLHNF